MKALLEKHKGSEQDIGSDDDDETFLNEAIERASKEFELLRQCARSEEQLWFEVNKDMKGEALREKIMKQIKFLRLSRKKGFAKRFVAIVGSLRQQMLLLFEVGQICGGGEDNEQIESGFSEHLKKESEEEQKKEVKEECSEEPPLKKAKTEKQFSLQAFFKGASALQFVKLPEKKTSRQTKERSQGHSD